MSSETGTDSDYGLLDTRYAIYFAPRPASPLKHFADAWLGRDPDRDERVPQPVVEGITAERLHEITAFPRHYGFHATLKAPFTPAPGVESDALLGDVEAFAAARRPLRVRLQGRRAVALPGAGSGPAGPGGGSLGRRLRA